MKKLQQLLCLLLCLVFCLALLPAAALAEDADEDAGTIAPAEEPAEEPGEGVIAPAADPDALTAPEDEPQEVYSGSCGDDLTWTLTDDGAMTISGTGDMTDWSSTSDVPWYSIRSSIGSVVIESGATSIGRNAFRGCSKMESISIPNTVAAIKGSVFADCTSLTFIRIPGSVQSFGSSLFTRCRALETVRLEYGIPEIGSYMFSSCESLQNIWLPESITKIGSNAFQDCTALTSVTFAGPAPTINSSAFTNVTATAYYPAGDATWTPDKLQNYGGSLTWVGLYGLRVDRTEVTDENKADILGNGIFSFDGDHTLTIHNNYSTSSSQPIIENYGLEGLEIRTETAATLNAERAEPVIRLAKDTTFTGESLTVVGEDTRGEVISADSTATVTVRNTKLTAYCAYGYGEELLNTDPVLCGGHWVIDNSCFSVSCFSTYRLMDVDGITLQNCYITTPEGGRISDDGRSIVTANGGRPSSVLIEPNLTGYYLIGPDGWTAAALDEANKFRKATGSSYNYVLQTSLNVNDPVKVVKADRGVITAWYPDGTGNEYVVDAVHAGDVTVTFRETYQNDWASFGGYFHVLHKFGIEVDGQSVTSDNMTDVLGDGIFSFDGDRTLTLNGSFKAGSEGVFVGGSLVPAFYRQHSLIENHTCDDLMIVFGQMASLSGYSLNDNGSADFEPAPGFLFAANTTLTGAGMTVSWDTRIYGGTAGLELVPSRSTIQVDSGAKLTVLDTVITDASTAGNVIHSIEGSDGAQLVINHSTVTVNNGVTGFTGGIELIGCKIVYPEGGRISDDGASIVNADGSKAAHVVIEPVASSAGQCGDELYWSIDIDSGKLTFSGTGDMWDFTVETVPWADSRSQIVSVEIPEGVTGIGDYAFTQCAFSSVTIPDSVTRIGEGAFESCKAESVTIPAGVTSIGKQAFYDCRLLSAFFVDEANASYSAVDGVLFSKDGTTLIVAPIAHEYSHYAIPAGVERIEDFAFANCGDMYSLELPVSLTEIGHAAFLNCSELTSVCFPQSLSAIGDLAFWHCAAMTEIRFLGHAPTFGTQPFNSVRANAYYPAADETWTEEVRQNYGGTLTWLPFDFYLPDGYYLIGPDGWEVVNVDPNEKFVVNPAIAAYTLTTTLTAGDPVKVVEVEDSAITTWYPDGLGNEYVVDAAHAGTVNIYFKPTYSSAWADFGGYIWIEADHEHSPAEAVQENYTEPTCTAEGGYDSVVYCSVCGAELSREHVVLSALGHLPGVPVEENYVAPTATEEGGYDMVTYCQRCDVELSREHTVLPATLDGFYLIVSQELIDTGSDANYQESNKFAPNPENEGEYILTTTLALRDHVRVCNVYCGSVSSWYPSSQGNDYRVDADHAGEVTVHFKPTYDSAWADFGGYIWIEKATAVKYGLRINGDEVTEDHLTDTAYSRWSFDADHTLSILGDINGEDFEYWNDDHTAGYYTVEIIENYGLDGLVVDFANHAKLKASYSSHFYEFPPVITASKDTVITGAGGGECLATGSGGYEGPGISVKDGVTLTIRDTELTVKSDYNAAILGEGSGTKLVVNNASLDAVGKTGSNAIQGFTGGIELIDCEIVYPEGGYVKDGAIVDADGTAASTVRIEPVAASYGIRIAGVEVTSENAGDVLGDGHFVYDPTSNKLTVSGSYGMESGPALENYGCEGLVIVGVNASISTDDGVVVLLKKDTTITGSLHAEKMYGRDPVISAEATVTVKDGGLSVYHGCDGVTNVEQLRSSRAIDGGTWIFDHASLDASTLAASVDRTSGGSILNWNRVTLTGSHIAEPEGGYVGDYGAIYNVDGSQYYSRVRIEPVVNPFVDVKEGKYYYEPVLWAYYHDPQITGGISDTEFGPNKTCTREQIVTFLWKAMGAPEPETTVNPFEDVKSTKYYYKAVLWAVENEVTGGMDATHFGVGKPCTREQAMTFLWKAMGSPEPTTTENPFEDVPSTKYYYKPVLWAVENGITSGVDATHFGVGKSCTRGQIVTFLYKAIVG